MTHSLSLPFRSYSFDEQNPETEVETAALIHEMAKRRFLPTRRDLLEQLDEAMDQSESHSNIKRYFFKTKRDFLDSEQDLVRHRLVLPSIIASVTFSVLELNAHSSH